MAQLDGKQIKSATVPIAALSSGVLRPDVAVNWTIDQNANGQKLTGLGAPVSGTGAARLQDVQNIPWKQSVRAASTANLTLSGTQTVDGISLISGDRVLCKDQTTASTNGIYVVAAGSWSRSADADSASEIQSAVVVVNEGTVNADKRFAQTADSVTLGSTSITFIDIGNGSGVAYATSSNKAMSASLTTADFQVATATTIASTPTGDAYVLVLVNGVGTVIGDGVRTKDCYFSADSGTTARTIANIAVGDTLYWVGSVAGFQLATTDKIDFVYDV